MDREHNTSKELTMYYDLIAEMNERENQKKEKK